MDSVLLITISAFVVTIILIIITVFIIKNNQNKKYKRKIEELDTRKNSLLGVPVLSEISKVKELVKTDNLKEKMDDWDNIFKYIRDEKIPSLTDSISDADFLIDRKEYKEATRKIANIEMELKVLKKKTEELLEEVKIITESEEFNCLYLKELSSKLKNENTSCKIEIKKLANILDWIGNSKYNAYYFLMNVIVFSDVFLI